MGLGWMGGEGQCTYMHTIPPPNPTHTHAGQALEVVALPGVVIHGATPVCHARAPRFQPRRRMRRRALRQAKAAAALGGGALVAACAGQRTREEVGRGGGEPARGNKRGREFNGARVSRALREYGRRFRGGAWHWRWLPVQQTAVHDSISHLSPNPTAATTAGVERAGLAVRACKHQRQRCTNNNVAKPAHACGA